MLKGHACSL
jgi:hypothetical protein